MRTSPRFHASLVAGAALFAVVTTSLYADAKLARSGAASTSFKAAGPAGMNIVGTTTDLTVADDGTTVTITVPLANLSTGIGLRDSHTKKALETDQFAATTLVVARAALQFPAAGGQSSGDTKGALTLHGQTKDVTFHYSATNKGGTISVSGSTSVNMNDFGIKPPSYLGVTVKPDVKIDTSFDVTDA